MIVKAKKDPQSSALDALLSEESGEHEGGEASVDAPEAEEKPQGDPAAIVAKIQADLDRLRSLIA